MATTKTVKRTPSGRVSYRGESFSGYNKPKRTSGGNKKFAVLAKKGDDVKLVRFGDPDMKIKKAINTNKQLAYGYVNRPHRIAQTIFNQIST